MKIARFEDIEALQLGRKLTRRHTGAQNMISFPKIMVWKN